MGFIHEYEGPSVSSAIKDFIIFGAWDGTEHFIYRTKQILVFTYTEKRIAQILEDIKSRSSTKTQAVYGALTIKVLDETERRNLEKLAENYKKRSNDNVRII